MPVILAKCKMRFEKGMRNDTMSRFDKHSGEFENIVDLTSLPDLTDIYELAYQVIEELPKKFRSYTHDIMIRVENFSDEQTLTSLNLMDKYDLLGLYRGIPIPLKASGSLVSVPDTIFLYRCPIIRFAEENCETIERLVKHVMIHEIGHHFGFSDFDMEWIERRP